METQNQTARETRQNGERRDRGEIFLAVPVDIFENDEEILILGDFPGVTAAALHVHLEGTELTLEAKREDGVLRRTFRVPRTVDGARVAAQLENGVLSVRLPKREEAKPRRIEVK